LDERPPQPMRWHDYVEAAAKILPILILLLPVVGVGVRFLSFRAGNVAVGSASRLAWSAPLNQLVGTGLGSLLPFLLVYPVFALILLRMHPENVAQARPSHSRLYGFLESAITAALVVWPLLVLTEWPLTVTLWCSGAVTFVVLENLVRRGRVTLLRAWPIPLALVLFATIYGGLRPVLAGVQPATYHFRPAVSAEVGDGRFAELGREDGVAYLAKCDGKDHPVVGVRLDDVSFIRLEPCSCRPSSQPSLWGLFVSHESSPVGLASPCG
jgi:hypothetical protein